MLSARLIQTIQDHAEDLTREMLKDLASNLGDKSDAGVEATYSGLGGIRAAEGVPLGEVVYALILIKEHLRGYIRRAGLVDSAVQLYLEEELNLMIGRFFDKALYYTVKGYEGARHSRV